VKSSPFADDFEGTVNARAIDGEPAATGTPDGIIVGLTHVTMPEQNVSQVELRYTVPENRLSELGISADEITAYRFGNSSWKAISVTVTETTETGTVLTAQLSNTTSSYFALAAPTVNEDSTAEDDMTDPDGSDDTSSDDSIPGFGMVVTIIAITALSVIAARRQ
jgi:PGF-CTERM protein